VLEPESLFESVPNFSEGRQLDAIEAISSASRAAHLLDADPDPDHNRVVLSIAGERAALLAAVMGAVAAAVERIDVSAHEGLHPRVGAADVVPIVPLGATRLEDCRELATEVGERIWAELKVPVFFYGYGTDRTLADIRAGRAPLDLGGPGRHPTAGAVCVGARPTLIAFNVLLPGCDLVTARRLARSLRESSGGMRGVQALVFGLPGGRVQLSMNFVRLEESRPADVLAVLERRGVEIGEQQLVGLCPAKMAGSFADGRLLEARLAAAAARAGAARCRRRGGEELSALARRLEREASGLSSLGADQESLLAGAERAAALVSVLRAAKVLDGELVTLLRVASRGLRAAITSATEAAYATRIAALDRRPADL
jgi:glutamate formiminotransferase